MRVVLGMIAGMILTVASVVGFSAYYYIAPGPLSQPQTVLFKRGEGFQAIVDDMGEQGVIRHPLLFKVIAVILGDARKFKAGEYEFSAAISPKLVMDMIAAGHVVVHKVTIPEGLTVAEIKQLLAKETLLEGEMSGDVAEGSLLPQTYHFTYGDTRATMITRMQAGMKSLLPELWEKRKADLPFTTPEQALTLASIVEKETGVDTERGRVAAVFINRLRKGMKLQSDPTVAYGIAKGKLERKLTLDDLKNPTPYNTYTIDGLPPAPIANPGQASIEAVLNPPDTNELYFVATGSGGHNFSATLKEHNENVKTYRKKIASKR